MRSECALRELSSYFHLCFPHGCAIAIQATPFTCDSVLHTSCDYHARWFRIILLEAMMAVRWMLAISLNRCRILRNWRVVNSFSNESTQPRFPTTAGTMSTRYPGYFAARSPFNPRYFARFSSVLSSTLRSFATATSMIYSRLSRCCHTRRSGLRSVICLRVRQSGSQDTAFRSVYHIRDCTRCRVCDEVKRPCYTPLNAPSYLVVFRFVHCPLMWLTHCENVSYSLPSVCAHSTSIRATDEP